MIPINQAIEIVRHQTAKLGTEEVVLSQVLNRLLAEDIVADTDLPPFDRAQMDGYAVRAADVANAPASLRIVGESAAGAGWHHEMKAGEAVRIMTGAPVPAGADAVQQVELTKEADSQVEILSRSQPGRSIVRQAQRNQFR
jgi:molybdopterin biosynthesis enzyme